MERKIPDPLLVKNEVITCYSCGHWMVRLPLWYGAEGTGNCDKCGCTSIKIRPGRPWGPRSKDWEWLMKEWHDFIRLDMLEPGESGREHILESVVMPPDFEVNPQRTVKSSPAPPRLGEERIQAAVETVVRGK